MKIQLPNNKTIITALFTIIAGSLLLSWVAFHNEFPLVYSDTGTYLISAINNEVPHDRPKLYGEFINITSNYSLWGTIVVQNIILCISLFNFYTTVSNKKSKGHFLFITALIAGLTGLSWYSGQLMPDVFSAILILSSLSIILRDRFSLINNSTDALIIIAAISFHNSHVVIAFLLAFTFVCMALLNHFQLISIPLNELNKKLKLLLGVFLIGAFTAPIVHYNYEGRFEYAKSSHVIILSKFAENGILKEYLQDKCKDPIFASDHKFCDCYENINGRITDFLYSPTSPLKIHKGWGRQSKEEYSFFIKDILSNPKYLKRTLSSSLQNIFSQLFSIKVGSGLRKYGEGTSTHYVMHHHFKGDAWNYDASLQNNKGLHPDSFDTINNVLCFGSILFSLYLISNPTLATKKQRMAVILILIAIVINSIASGGLHVCYDRFQTRVVWLLPLISLIIISNNKSIIKTFKLE